MRTLTSAVNLATLTTGRTMKEVVEVAAEVATIIIVVAETIITIAVAETIITIVVAEMAVEITRIGKTIAIIT